jgi:hypothetical protein
MYDNILVDRNIRLSTSIFILVEALKEITETEDIQNARHFAQDALNLYNKVKGMHDGCEAE